MQKDGRLDRVAREKLDAAILDGRETARGKRRHHLRGQPRSAAEEGEPHEQADEEAMRECGHAENRRTIPRIRHAGNRAEIF